MVAKSSRLHTVGQTYHQFKLVNVVEIPELQCLLRELIHEPSGARIMHIGNEDPENLFCLSFQTLPYNSNGVAHILEHTVLCGSKKFPVKDPFFAMNRRSLNTFMNALTGADFTCYPAATQVHKDFYNLLEVYLDAVFHPNLNELSFLQEGHRLEFAHPSDPSTPLEYKGIVYNEMKGALSSPGARLAEAITETLFPSVTYGVNSGGDPKVIPELTYEELKDFYHTFYHPSRCLFFFYGNMPLEGHLDFIAEQTLNQTAAAPSLPPIPLQPRFKEPVYRELTYPIAPEEDLVDKTLIAFGWLTCHILEQEEVLALNILEIILMDTDASPLKMALLKSGWCKQANSFIDIELNEVPWGITLKGCNPDKANELEEVIKRTLKDICHSGIPIQMIENAIHQLEFHRSEITGDHAPFGLSLFMRSALLKQHGADPAQGLKIHSLFDKLRKRTLADPHYFSGLIQKHLLDNPHFIRIIMQPDKSLGAKEAQEEKEKLEAVKASLSSEQAQAIVKKAAQLASFQKQQEEEDVEVLPKVSLQDIPPRARDYPLVQEKMGELTLFHHSVFTNDIVYADLVFDLPDLPEEDLPYLRLLTIVLTQVGCNGRSYTENLDFIQGNTGGIGAGISLNLQARNPHHFSPTFHLRGKALHRKASKLFPLMHDVISSARIDELKRFKEILFKHFTGMESRLNQSALKYAINLSASALNIASKVANDLYGLNYYWKIRDIVKDFDKQGPYALSKIQELQEQVTCLENPHLVLSCDSATYDELKGHGFYGLAHMETKPFKRWEGRYSLSPLPSQGRLIASPVAFIGKVFPTVSYTHPDAPALNIAAFLFDNLTLHTRIREQGGAYGGGAVSNPMSGNFYFYSYRDPNVAATFKAFQEAVNAILKGDFDDSDLEEAKFEMIQALDSPISPGSQAELAYGWWREGRTFEVRQAFRNKLLALTREEIIEAVKRIIVPEIDKGTTVVFAGKELLEKANQDLQAEGQSPLLIEGI
ncbi:insulinase family protein [Candidatus Protochlamydia phocaeensis]|uniref:insulinase family protein n=1 Tax=Candidatus Protochlamydia phocaeensis TaxID=1414722 RepID=UPI000839990D|nr:insulinase family protein [Candidatus Protochlamydia phocaeensis]